ncbi:MAG: BlaI/MecI/CopY family transcriptional regulator [Planctomycetota bacterium]
MKNKIQPLGKLELEIMKVIWEHHDVSVADVLSALQKVKYLHHNTVMTVMNRLVQKGILDRYARDGRTQGYRAKVSQKEVTDMYLKNVTEQLFDGSTPQMIAAFFGLGKPSPVQLSKLQKMVDEIKEENK